MTTPPFDAIELVAFMPTPFGDGGIDEYAVEQQMEHYRDTGVTVGLLGGLGEFYAVSHDEATQLMRASVEGIGGEGKVLAAVGFATREAVRLAESAARVGCRGLVVNPPYYVHPSPQAFAEHLRSVTEASGLDAVVYSSTHLAIDDSYLDALVNVDGFRGVKDELSSPDEFTHRVKRWGDRVDFWAVGEHTAVPYVAAGAKAVTSALASVCPEASREHLAGTDRTGELAQLVHDSVRLLGVEPGTSASVAKEMIAAVRPWPTGVRGPQTAASDSLRSAVRELVVTMTDRYKDAER
ncbi:dihydrodipicolinate synthase family protein [Rhodococcus jostii]|uniref:5-dehydro-4-deoxyglucarate dehydratase n=1 Tax=Rhodococcus jostii TaxID=132919 RepID=A0A1H4QW40_RHOJO|nr:dihydrodipicolinate synthase family protein [Rhodococcus jostii]TQC41224.1 dihydrodipicolinate synthase family protein [Rhodococcus sp. WS4]SEC23748.1 5-dehydro-4-deoxyglucarate dehydratase [Rhodococcus jostii]